MDFSEAYSYSWKILVGLVFSALGDVLLVFKNYGFFVHGIAAFAMAQILYAWAFDIWPLKLYVGAICAAIASTIYMWLLPGLDGIMVYLGMVYCGLIFTMMWRAIARVQFFDDQWRFTQDLWKWTKLCSCIGAFFFVLSDFTIAIDKFVTPVPYAHAIIMVTYYAAQFHITVSVVDSQVDEVLRITREETEGTISGNLIRKIQQEAREPVQKIKEGVATATHKIENLDTIKTIRNGINSIENSERVQKIKQGIAEAQHRIESSEPVQIIKQGITRLETSEPVLRLRNRLSSRHELEAETEASISPDSDTTDAVQCKCDESELAPEPDEVNMIEQPQYISSLLTHRSI